MAGQAASVEDMHQQKVQLEIFRIEQLKGSAANIKEVIHSETNSKCNAEVKP